MSMLDSIKITRRQSEIRQSLAELVGKETPTEDETRSMSDLDGEYRTNETRYRAALTAEDEERKEAGAELETRDGKEWSDMLGRYEIRQAALALSEEGRELEGETAEIVQEMRAQGSYQGIPVPYEALLETRAGETIASGTPDPINTMPIIDRLFADSVATQMGGSVINIPHGEREWPVVTSSITAAWAATETGNVAAAAAFATTDRAMAPDNTLGVQMKVTRKTLKQSGPAIEAAIRRDMQSAIRVKLDEAAFLGTGASGEPLGVIQGASTYGITETIVNAVVDYADFRSAVVRFLTANAANGPGSVNLLLRPEIFDSMDDAAWDAGSGITEWDRLISRVGKVVMSTNALAAPAGTPLESKGLMTVNTGGVPPLFMGLWGGVDLIRDVFTDAPSGGLRLTGLVTADVTVARPAQLEVLTELQ
jgi:HK97 family phage major capsid protein